MARTKINEKYCFYTQNTEIKLKSWNARVWLYSKRTIGLSVHKMRWQTALHALTHHCVAVGNSRALFSVITTEICYEMWPAVIFSLTHNVNQWLYGWQELAFMISMWKDSDLRKAWSVLRLRPWFTHLKQADKPKSVGMILLVGNSHKLCQTIDIIKELDSVCPLQLYANFFQWPLKVLQNSPERIFPIDLCLKRDIFKEKTPLFKS